MEQHLVPGEAVEERTPASVETPQDALAAAGHRPVVVEAWDGGARFQAHLAPSGTTVLGDVDAEQVTGAVAQVAADSAILLGRVAGDGVRFDDLLWLDGTSLAGHPTSERLERLAHVAPVALMVQRTTLEDPGWAGPFLDHVREQGHEAVRIRVLSAPWPAGPDDDWVAPLT